MKKYLFLLFTISLLSGCIYLRNVDDGSGYLGQIYGNVANEDKENFDSYVLEHGVPTSRYALQTGALVFSYIKPCPDGKGQEETSIIVNQNNKIEKILPIRTCQAK